jgi:ATP-dependent DNA helicase RecQ
LYIGDFISELQKKKIFKTHSNFLFYATAKQKVIEDIKFYFKDKLKVNLEVFRATSTRTNLHYRVFQKDNDEDKYKPA